MTNHVGLKPVLMEDLFHRKKGGWWERGEGGWSKGRHLLEEI